MFWRRILREECCPQCGNYGSFSRHGVYKKYHYRRLVPILRIRCKRCGTTHAVIPSFSVPGTSLDLEDVETFIHHRRDGMSRRAAGEIFGTRGLGAEYVRSLERRLIRGIHQAKALFPELGDHRLHTWNWLLHATDGSRHPVYRLNTLSIAAGRGAVFCALTPVTIYRNRKPGSGFSHEKASARLLAAPIDSG